MNKENHPIVSLPSSHLSKIVENKTQQNMRDLRISLTSGDENYMKEFLKCGGIQSLLEVISEAMTKLQTKFFFVVLFYHESSGNKDLMNILLECTICFKALMNNNVCFMLL
jgi:hypothetical protein